MAEGHAIDVRQFFYPRSKPETAQPTKRGIRLYMSDSTRFLYNVLPEVMSHWREAQDGISCRYGHDTEDEVDACEHCNPRVLGAQRSESSESD